MATAGLVRFKAPAPPHHHHLPPPGCLADKALASASCRSAVKRWQRNACERRNGVSSLPLTTTTRAAWRHCRAQATASRRWTRCLKSTRVRRAGAVRRRLCSGSAAQRRLHCLSSKWMALADGAGLKMMAID
eukprot:356907-Chlamydomonas_euryale.AAC.5